MKRIVSIFLFSVCAFSLSAKKQQPQPLSVEREQQFTYYFYAARQSLDKERFPEALMQLLFCEQLNPQDATTKDYLGVIYNALKQPEKAFEYFRQAYLLDPRDHWYHYALLLYKNDDKHSRKELLAVMKQATRLNPKDASVWDYMRQAALANGKYNQAIQAQDRIDQLQGYDGMSAINRYRIYVIQGDLKKAMCAIDDYLVLYPDDLRFLLFHADLLTAIQAPTDQLLENYEHILRIDPANLMILNNYAYLLATSGGDLRKAEQMSQQTIREQPENPTFLDTYAWILHLQGQDSLAAFYIRKALQNATPDERTEIEAHYHAIIK